MVRPRLGEGAVIDGFTVGPLLHSGGMALLFGAHHPEHGSELLLKVPRLFEGDDPAAIVSFEMELMILPRLAGAHVPRVFGHAGFERQPYLAMERIPGESAEGLLARGPMPHDEVAAIGARVADALDSLHRQNVVHLDLKPANLLFRPSGEAVLIDYGLAHHLQLPDLMAEEFRLPYGSAPYMAPEQVMGIRDDPRSDLFALGALLYRLATGAFPFGSPERLKGLKRRLWRDPDPPRLLRSDTPPWLQELILRCLEVEPRRRHPSAAQLALELRHPDQVALGPRAAKLRQDGWPQVIRRRFNPDAKPVLREPRRPLSPEAGAPILAVAVDLSPEAAAIAGALRTKIGHILASLPGARVACLNVLKQKVLGIDTDLDPDGHNRHVQRLVELHHWAEPMRLPEGRVTFHVLEAVNPAAAILDYVRQNRVDHVVLGARAESLRRALLGSVSAEVAAHAPCSVTIVRVRSLDPD